MLEIESDERVTVGRRPDSRLAFSAERTYDGRCRVDTYSPLGFCPTELRQFAAELVGMAERMEAEPGKDAVA